MRQNELPVKYSLKTANIALLALLLIYSAFDILELIAMFVTGRMPDLESAMVARLFAMAPVVIIALVSARPSLALRFKAPGAKNVLYAILLAFFSYLAVKVLVTFIASAIISTGRELPQNLVDQVLSNAPVLLEALLLCVFAPFTEEILFRGMVQNSFERRFGLAAFVIAGLLFGWTHAEPLSIINGALTGLLLGYIYIKTRSLWMPIIFHAVYNFLAFTFVPDIFVINLPWTLGLFPAQSMDFSNFNYTVYSIGIAAIGLLMSYVMLRLIALHNPHNRAAAEPGYQPERGATALFILVLVVLAVRTLPGILAYLLQ